MRWILIFTLLTMPAWARSPRPTSRLLVCLGAQEKSFHKQKAGGAFYDLNQRLISELLQTQGVDGTPMLLTQVCKKTERSSIHLLEAMLLDPNGWYVIKTGPTGLTRELMKEMAQAAPEMLLNFLAALQAEAPTPDCLEKHIPSLKKLNEEVKVLQEEMDLSKITNKKSRLTKIFAGVQRSDEIFAVCAKEKSKKTDKAAGKPSAQ
jgi:hypothetical protein